MSAKIICISGFSKPDEIKLIKHNIAALGGEFSSNLETKAFCLIVNKAGSEKHKAAVKSGIPCVDIKWLTNSAREGRYLPMADFGVALWKGLVVTCTQIPTAERLEIERLVASNGGEFISDLVQGRTTHLLAISRSGDKFHNAYRWKNVKICLPTWIYDCVSQKKWLDEDIYKLPNPNTASSASSSINNSNNPNKNSNSNSMNNNSNNKSNNNQVPSQPEPSPSGDQRISSAAPSSNALRKGASSSSLDNLTNSLSAIPPQGSQLPLRSSSNSNSSNTQSSVLQRLLISQSNSEKSATDDIINSSSNDSTAAEPASPRALPSNPFQVENEVISLVQNFKLWQNINPKQFNVFRNEFIFIYGFPADIQDGIVQLIYSCGGMRHHALTLNTTKILIGEGIDTKTHQLCVNHPLGVPIARLSWLIESAFDDDIEALWSKFNQACISEDSQSKAVLTNSDNSSQPEYTENTESKDVNESIPIENAEENKSNTDSITSSLNDDRSESVVDVEHTEDRSVAGKKRPSDRSAKPEGKSRK